MFSIEKLNNLINEGYEKAINENKTSFIAFYAFLFADPAPCASCPEKLKGYWNKLTTSGITILTQKEMRKESVFKLKPQITSLQMDFGSSEWFNNDTLTDETALRYLSINKNRIANFETYPNNWESLLKDFDNGKAIDTLNETSNAEETPKKNKKQKN